MRTRRNRRKAGRPKARLGLPDLEQARSAVLVSLRSSESQRSYRRSIDDFVTNEANLVPVCAHFRKLLNNLTNAENVEFTGVLEG